MTRIKYIINEVLIFILALNLDRSIFNLIKVLIKAIVSL